MGNSVVEDVIVHKYTGTDEVSQDAGGSPSVVNSWTITFIKNSGDVPNLGVRYTATVDALNSNAGHTETDNGGQFRALSGVIVDGSGSVTDDKLAEAIGVCAFRTCASDGLSEPASTANQYIIDTDSTASNPQIVFHTTGRPGSQENSVCSNRGCAITVRDFASVSMDLPMMTAVVRTPCDVLILLTCFFFVLCLCFVIKSQYTK